jgi:hypothetical protein
MIGDIKSERSDDMQWLDQLIDKTINDDFVIYQKEEATRKLLLSQINFLK